MISNKELLEWIDKNIERTRRNAMHAHMRGDSLAFTNINIELVYWLELGSVVEERMDVGKEVKEDE